jgi:hypothetical protein
MLHDVVAVRHLGEYKLHLVFDDGVGGEVDVSSLVGFFGVFEPLRSIQEFAKVTVNRELGTIVWPNGADLDPVVLYSTVTGQPIDLAHQHA